MEQTGNFESENEPGKLNYGGEPALRVAFKMQLFKGFEAEYERRHKNLWPDLKELLKSNGIREYSIFLDEKSDQLFCIMTVDNLKILDELAAHPVMMKWWDYMKDVMETNGDNSPVITSLKEIFYLA